MKREALAAHSSQSDNIFFLNFSLPVFTELFGTEEFVRGHDPMNGPLPEDDLFFQAARSHATKVPVRSLAWEDEGPSTGGTQPLR